MKSFFVTFYHFNQFKFRTLIEGDFNAGFTIFWADDGLDTGPILLQRQTKINLDDTVDTLYNRFLYPGKFLEWMNFSKLFLMLLKKISYFLTIYRGYQSNG